MLGCLGKIVGLAAVIVVAALLWDVHDTTAIVVGIVGVIVVLVAGTQSKLCDICGNRFRGRTLFVWKIEGKKKRVCQQCSVAIHQGQNLEELQG